MVLRSFKGILGGFLICLISFSSFALETPTPKRTEKDSGFKVAGVPPGFQFLMEKQTTAIDVFYGDVYITTTLASYTPTTVEFHNPEEVVAQLKNLISPGQVEEGLKGEIDSHAGEVCYRDIDSDCGILTPDSVGVIFDEGHFRADIFINPNLLALQQLDYNRFLPLSESGFSHINNISMAASGGSEGNSQIGLSNQSLLSYKEQRVISNWGYSDNGDGGEFNMSTLYWQFDKNDFQYQAGWFNSETRYMSFVPNLNILGFRYSTSFKARTDLNFANGMPIQVFLVSRSTVNIYKDGRLVSSAFYNPGNQQLDTSNLPDGAYNIEIRIIDTSGRQETPITRFYVKSQRLAPSDQDLYFFEGGDIQYVSSTLAFPESQNISVMQGGYSHRLTSETGLNVGSAATESELLVETGIYYVNDWFDLEPKILTGTAGDYGWSLGGYGRLGKWFGSYQFRRVWAENHLLGEYYLIPDSLKQHMLSISHELWEGYAQLRYSVSRRGVEDTAEDIGLSYMRPFELRRSQLNFTADFTKTNTDTIILFGLSTNWYANKVSNTISGDIRQDKSDLTGRKNFIRGGYFGSWSDEDWRPEDINLQWHAQADNDLTAMGSQMEVQNYLGSARLGVDFNQTNINNTYQYSGELSTSEAGEGSELGVGGKNGALGALIIEVTSDQVSEAKYDVLINNYKYGEIAANEKIVVPVAAYQTYRVSVADKGTNYVDFSNDLQSVTIYPGNVRALKWNARSLGILIGRIVHKIPGCFNDNDASCWDPLVNAKAKGVNDFAATDSDGYIQVEVYKANKSFTLIRKGQECKVDFSKAEFVENLAYIEQDIKCYDIDSIGNTLK